MGLQDIAAAEVGFRVVALKKHSVLRACTALNAHRTTPEFGARFLNGSI